MTDKYPDDNPKTLSGLTKVPLNLVPPSAKHFLAEAFADGARKYGPYNWREKNVSASIYYAAAQRHMDAWWDGEEVSLDAGVHHIAHAMACMAIILDALTVGALNDDRPAPGASPDLQRDYAEYTKKEEQQNDRTDAPTGFNPVDFSGPVNDVRGLFAQPADFYPSPGTAVAGGAQPSDAVESLRGLFNLQEDLLPSFANSPVDVWESDPSVVEGSRFLYGNPSGAEYWGLPNGRVARYHQPSTRGD